MSELNEMNEMAADIYNLIDEDGVEQQFELIDVMEFDGECYSAFIPYFENPADDLEADTELVILKSSYDENNDEVFDSIDNDEEYEKIGNMFLERLNTLFDEEE